VRQVQVKQPSTKIHFLLTYDSFPTWN